MSTIHKTTMVPGKLELVAGWIVDQPWYVAHDGPLTLAKAGGFRLDDPAGAVGCEFMVVSDTAEDGSVTWYHVPVTYRGAALDGADAALVGTADHGVLGRRWAYDGTHDPVLRAATAAFLNGELQAQAQSESDALDPTVEAFLAGRPATPDDVEFVRVLAVDRPLDGARGHVTAGWLGEDGEHPRGVFVLVR